MVVMMSGNSLGYLDVDICNAFVSFAISVSANLFTNFLANLKKGVIMMSKISEYVIGGANMRKNPMKHLTSLNPWIQYMGMPPHQ